MKIRPLLLLLILFSSACVTQNNIKMLKNRDCEITHSETSYLVCFGEATQKKSEEEAKESAKMTAFINMASHFWIRVSGLSTSIEVEKSGKYEYEFKSKGDTLVKPITVKSHRIVDSDSSRKNSKYNALVRISITKTEYERIRTEIEELEKMNRLDSGNAVWALSSNIPECENKIRDFFPVFRQKRVSVLVDKRVDFDRSTDEIAEEFQDKAKYLLKVECNEDTNEPDPYGKRTFYSFITLKIELLDLSNKNVINSWSATKKGAMLGLEAARKHGIEQAVEAIRAQIKD